MKYLLAPILLVLLQIPLTAQTSKDFEFNRLLFFQKAITNNLSDSQLEALLPDNVKEFKVHPLGSAHKLEGFEWYDNKDYVDENFNLELLGYKYLGTQRGYITDGNLAYQGSISSWINCSKELVLEIAEAKSIMQVKLLQKRDHVIFKQKCDKKQDKGSASLSMPGWVWDSPPKVDNTNNERGLVEIEIIIDKRGNVISSKIISYSVSPSLSKAYLRETESLSFMQASTETPPVMTTGKISIRLE